MSRAGTIAATLCMLAIVVPTGDLSAARPNVLLIIADDLRPDLGCFGHREVQSPHIDRLASRGLVFRRAYCQVALCNPSRTSLLTGLRPDATKVYGNGGHFRDQRPEAVTLPQYFKSQGYHVQGLGKIFHPGLEDPSSWSVPHWDPTHPAYGPAGRRAQTERVEALRASGKKLPKHILGPAWEAADAGDEELTDGQTAERAVAALGELRDRPFFLAVGFLRPHLPLVAPRKYWDLYPLDRIVTAANPLPPRDGPTCALHDWSELRRYAGMPATGPLSDDQARHVIQGYRASTSYLDAQVGRLLDELDRLQLTQNTVVTLLGDHGWQLGEHGLWCKHTNFEAATRAPLIISAPGRQSAGGSTSAFVEFIDLYPTLVELCGLPPASALDGASLVPLIDDPTVPGKPAAYSQFERKIDGVGMVMGRSVRTARYRFTQWRSPTSDFLARELYDHQLDPGEDINLAGREEHAETVRRHAKMLD